jgi:hypothetical protein
VSDRKVRVALLSLVLLAAACGNEVVPRLQPAGEQVPGTRRVSCQLSTAHGPELVTLDLPRGFVDGLPPDYEKEPGCSWHRTVKVPDDGNFDGDAATQDTYDSDLLLTLTAVDRGESLQDVYDEVAPDAVKGEDPAGDDSILHLRLRKDVPTYGTTRGDRLSYWCFCDGQNTLSRMAQADGVRLTWASVKRLQRSTDAQLEQILASVGAG